MPLLANLTSLRFIESVKDEIVYEDLGYAIYPKSIRIHWVGR